MIEALLFVEIKFFSQLPSPPRSIDKNQPFALLRLTSIQLLFDGYGNAWCESFGPVPIKFAKNQLNISGAVSKQVCFVKLCSIYCFLLLLIFLEFLLF